MNRIKNALLSKEGLIYIFIILFLLAASHNAKAAELFGPISPRDHLMELYGAKTEKMSFNKQVANDIASEIEALRAALKVKEDKLYYYDKNNDCIAAQLYDMNIYLQSPEGVRSEDIENIHNIGTSCMAGK